MGYMSIRRKRNVKEEEGREKGKGFVWTIVFLFVIGENWIEV